MYSLRQVQSARPFSQAGLRHYSVPHTHGSRGRQAQGPLACRNIGIPGCPRLNRVRSKIQTMVYVDSKAALMTPTQRVSTGMHILVVTRRRGCHGIPVSVLTPRRVQAGQSVSLASRRRMPKEKPVLVLRQRDTYICRLASAALWGQDSSFSFLSKQALHRQRQVTMAVVRS